MQKCLLLSVSTKNQPILQENFYTRRIFSSVFILKKTNFYNSNTFQIRLEDDFEEERSKKPLSILIMFDSDNSLHPKQLYVEYSLGIEFQREREPDTDESDFHCWQIKDAKACVLLKSMKLEKSTNADFETKQMLISLFPVKMDITTPTNLDTTYVEWDKQFQPARSDGVMIINSPPLKWNYLPDLPERAIEYLCDRKIVYHGIDKTTAKKHFFAFSEHVMVQAKRKGNSILVNANERLRERLHSPTFCSKFFFRSIYADCVRCGDRFCASTVDGEFFLSPEVGENKTCRTCTR